jgi:hypothetical protein
MLQTYRQTAPSYSRKGKMALDSSVKLGTIPYISRRVDN